MNTIDRAKSECRHFLSVTAPAPALVLALTPALAPAPAPASAPRHLGWFLTQQKIRKRQRTLK